jgi:hypothetical protein
MVWTVTEWPITRGQILRLESPWQVITAPFLERFCDRLLIRELQSFC